MAVTSGVTLTFECFCGHQLEYLKILRQTTMQPYGVILRDILARKGVMGLWDGFVPWGLLQSVSKGAVFGLANANIKRGLRAEPGSAQRYRFGLSPGLADTIAGAGAGGVQGLVLSPTLLLKTRVMTDPRYHAATSGNVSAARASLESFRLGTRVITDEGVGSLMKGAGTFAAKRVGDWGTRFALTNAAESALFGRHHGLSYLQQIQASLIGGFLSALSTIPLDVAVANLQAASSAGASVSPLGAFLQQYRSGGVNGVLGFATRGFVARATHVALTTVVVKTGSSFVTNVLDDDHSGDRH